MALNNPWVGYLDRSHLQIKDSILKRLGETNPEITDHSESNILVVLISIFSGVSEMLNYYIDNMAREAFITTARRYSSAVKHTRLIDYRIKAGIPSSTDLHIILYDELNQPMTIPSYLEITAGKEFYTPNNTVFISTQDVVVNPGDNLIIIPIEQKQYVEDRIIGSTSANVNSIYEVGTNYVNDSMLLKIGGQVWNRVDTLGRSGPDDHNYIVEITADRKAVIKFGDDINGKVPEPGLEILASYYITEGEEGNVDANTITTTNYQFDLETLGAGRAKNIRITNPTASTGGTNYESLDRIKRSAPLSLRTLDRAVTRQDYVDIAMLAPGVDKATVHFDCGKFVDIYISPNGGGLPSSTLLSNTKDYIEKRKMITTEIQVKPAGESFIVLAMEVWAKFRMDTIQTTQDILTALEDRYGYESSNVNRSIRKSDIIALIDNLPKVDYLNLTKLYLKPYIRTTQGNMEMYADVVVMERNNKRIEWTIQYDGNYMRLYRENVFEGNINIGQKYTDSLGLIDITIPPGNYRLGDEWKFVIYPFGENIEVDDFTVPIISLENISIKVNKQIMK